MGNTFNFTRLICADFSKLGGAGGLGDMGGLPDMGADDDDVCVFPWTQP